MRKFSGSQRMLEEIQQNYRILIAGPYHPDGPFDQFANGIPNTRY